jgi:hypothetical protein
MRNNPDNDRLFDELVPAGGPAQTEEGELLRAANRIWYSWFNDGDYIYQGYGIETAAPAFCYLWTFRNKVPGLEDALLTLESSGDGKTGDSEYSAAIEALIDVVVNYVKNQDKYNKNSDDSRGEQYDKMAIEKFGDPNEEEEEEEEEQYDEDDESYDESIKKEASRLVKSVLAETEEPHKKVRLNLVSLDGNAFYLMGAFRRQAMKEGWSQEEIKAVLDDCKSGDYDHLLQVLIAHCSDDDSDEDENEIDFSDQD